jgi:hypothetical protein
MKGIDQIEIDVDTLTHRNDSLILLNGKYRNHLQREEIQDTLLVIYISLIVLLLELIFYR